MSAKSPQWSNPSDVMKRRKLKKKSKSIGNEFSISSQNQTSNNDKPVKVLFGGKRSNPFSQSESNKRRAIYSITDMQGLLKETEKNEFRTGKSTNQTQLQHLIMKNGDSTLELVTSGQQQNNCQGIDKLCSPKVENVPSSNMFSILDSEEKVISNTTPMLGRSVSLFQRKGKELNERLAYCAENISEENCNPKKVQDNTTQVKRVDNIPSLIDVPVDWSLKCKLRVVSEESLSWCVQMKSTDESCGLHHFVGRQDEWQQNSQESSFHRCALFWQHPNLPWTKLFPRIVSENKISKPNVIVNNDDIKKSLFSDWVDSFTSVFHQLRSNYCPYFYLCTHQFTVLFRGVGVAGNNSITAVLSPTTRGFREALKIEGIQFTLPVLERKKDSIEEEGSKSKTIKFSIPIDDLNQDTPDNKIEEDDALETDEGASVWLESMGLDKKQFPSLDPNKVKIQKEGYRKVDNRPESMVFVEGGEVQGLFNFLLNCRSCIASSGEQAGLPPTILSPSPFRGATVKSNKVKHSCAKQTDSQGHSHKSHILEISGPLLPHNILNMTSLLQQKIDGQFTFTFNNHEPTAPFNMNLLKDSNRVTDRHELNDVNLRSDVKSSLFSSHKLEKDVCCVKSLVKTQGGFNIII